MQICFETSTCHVDHSHAKSYRGRSVFLLNHSINIRNFLSVPDEIRELWVHVNPQPYFCPAVHPSALGTVVLPSEGSGSGLWTIR